VSESHRSSTQILNRRTLEHDHRVLGEMLRPGMSVLDCGCGTGAITIGIARAVGTTGRVVGLDRDEMLIEQARSELSRKNLQFVAGDISLWQSVEQFDIVTAARTLQWIARPEDALRHMAAVCRRGGWLVVLDYSHRRNGCEPEPPQEFMRVYDAFLRWREANGWDNEMADHLPDLFEEIGLEEIRAIDQDEISIRGEPDFAIRSRLWVDSLDNLAEPLAASRFCEETELRQAQRVYAEWVETTLERQILALKAVVGRVPG
jgi:SAM-dependent methyltransferase